MPASVLHFFFYFLSFLQDGAKDLSLSRSLNLLGIPSKDGQLHRRHNASIVSFRGSELPAPVHVVYSSDARTFSSMLVSMLSLARSLSSPSSCTIHLIVAESDQVGAQKLVRCFNAELRKESRQTSKSVTPEVLIHMMKTRTIERNATTTTAPAWVRRFWQTPAAYVRLHLHEYLPSHIRQVLWLDTDTIVQADPTHLIRKSMTHPIGAVFEKKTFLEVYPEWVSDACDFLPPSFNRRETFFNSGVLMVNLAMWRKSDIVQRIEEVTQKVPGADDQFLLNMAFYRDVEVLDARWNLLGLGEPSAFWNGLRRPTPSDIEAAHVLHFTGMCKPSPDRTTSDSKCTSDYAHVYHRYCMSDTCVYE